MLKTLWQSRILTGLLFLGTPLYPLTAMAGPAPQQADQTEEAKREHSSSGEHQIEQMSDVLERAKTGLERIKSEIQDYEFLLSKQELVDGRRQPMQHIMVKIRHEQKKGDKITTPFSAYLKFLAPTSIKGREAIYVEGKNNGDVIARRGGRRNPNMTVQLAPDSPMAMDGNRYPITEIGFVTMIERLVEVMEKEIIADGCEFKIFDDAKLDGRECIHFQLTEKKKRPDSLFMMARIFVDKEMRVPIYYAAYDWPKEEGGKPVLLEEYTYRKIKLNVGFTDNDFDPDNPDYQFSDVEPLDSATDKTP